jgi:hypothetical protein
MSGNEKMLPDPALGEAQHPIQSGIKKPLGKVQLGIMASNPPYSFTLR